MPSLLLPLDALPAGLAATEDEIPHDKDHENSRHGNDPLQHQIPARSAWMRGAPLQRVRRSVVAQGERGREENQGRGPACPEASSAGADGRSTSGPGLTDYPAASQNP